MPGRFAGLGKAKAPGKGGNYFQKGGYLVELQRCLYGTSAQQKGDYFAVEAVVREILLDQGVSNKIGEVISWVVMFNHQPAMSNIKGFIAAACEMDVNEIDDGDEEFECDHEETCLDKWQHAALKCVEGDGETLKGLQLVCDCVVVETRKKTPFTRVTWYPLNNSPWPVAEAPAAE